MTSNSIFADLALLPSGWARQVRIDIDDQDIAAVCHDSKIPKGVKPVDLLLPALANLHSHAFQYAMAGLAEARPSHATATHDSFWTWRERMYALAASISPEQLEAIATHLYQDLAAKGFSAVAEFHYLHHDVDGQPYADGMSMCHALVRAADKAGLQLCLLPVLYSHSQFGGQAPNEGQRRFIHSSETYIQLLEDLQRYYQEHPSLQLGCAFHSLRAVKPEQIREVCAWLDQHAPTWPRHIHIAEQQKEVDDCLAWSGKRPVHLLADTIDLDRRWCLVHATHLDDDELALVAASGAVAGLCPATEANLGDGIFRGREFVQLGGNWGIGTDSHVSTCAREELKLLELSQRLHWQQRLVMLEAGHSDLAANLWQQAARGGAQALGLNSGEIAAGRRASFMAATRKLCTVAELNTEEAFARSLFGPENLLEFHPARY